LRPGLPHRYKMRKAMSSRLGQIKEQRGFAASLACKENVSAVEAGVRGQHLLSCSAAVLKWHKTAGKGPLNQTAQKPAITTNGITLARPSFEHQPSKPLNRPCKNAMHDII